MNGFKKILFGVKMPDKDDPKYSERYEKEVSAGRNFARKTRLDVAIARLQRLAEAHPKTFIRLLVLFVTIGTITTLGRMAYLVKNMPRQGKAVELPVAADTLSRDTTVKTTTSLTQTKEEQR